MLRIVLFLCATAGILYVSRKSILHPEAHGFYRFWAWEAIAALILLNAPVWFRDPFSWNQIVSWPLLIASIAPVVLGLRSLASTRRAGQERTESSLLGFERTGELITAGVYGYIRHPMYSSLLLLAWGAFFKLPSWWGTILVAVAMLSLVLTARVEEREDIRYFGAAYESYIQRTRRFIPFLW